ncbi:tyrosine-type recombinase/integrase [Deinococcus humi]|uniref:Integrase n=1 Tax=Deinococcus humi TaxID=662880 RepID=A0A7W8JXG8_9DEIO|nr:tyrosine-type recombinase/integrase [Deinococcus humi]MBB5363536.1 integrase [Deinococcus humi]GGO30334.1 hypothetical protein GCM10008949_25070 [Deinococcus humi]
MAFSRVLQRGPYSRRLERPGNGEGDFVFTRPDGAPPNPDSLRKLFLTLCDKAGVRTITIHGLRHTYVTLMADQGMSIDIVAKLVGHQNSAITRDVYRHLFEGKLEQAVRAMPALFKNGVGD